MVRDKKIVPSSVHVNFQPLESQHTSTPFEALDGDIWSGQKLAMIGNLPSKEIDAAFIVRAVNAYEKDQQIKEELCNCLRQAIELMEGDLTTKYHQQAFRRAIAKAEGK